ncbi:MAG: protein kinase domain-containing protein [Gemmatimonadota bacterium]
MSEDTVSAPGHGASQHQPPEHPATEVRRGSSGAGALPAAIGPGSEIAGYRVEEQIGQGGMAAVYRAHDERLNRPVALKLLAPALATDTAFRQRFIRESRAASAVDHPNIIPVYDAGETDGILYIAMRYVHGGDVGSLVRRDGPLAPARAWAIISQVASALDAAHEHGLIHRDVKPANMLLDAGTATGWLGPGAAAGRAEHVYLSDFGISKQSVATAGTLTKTGQFVGTLDYIAPEQLQGGTVDGRTDLYSLGCAAFELLSGVPPFHQDREFALIRAHLADPPPLLTAHRAGIPPDADRVLARAMAKSPAERHATCAEFARDLGRALGLVAAGPSPPPLAPVPPQALQPTAPAAAGLPVPPAGPVTPAGPVPPTSADQIPTALTPGPVTGGTPPGGTGWPQQPPQRTAYGQSWPPGPGWQEPPPRRRSRSMIIAVITAVVVLLAAGAAAAVYFYSHRQPGTPAPTAAPSVPASSGQPPVTSAPPSEPVTSPQPNPAARAQATDISNLLQTGHGSSTQLSDAAANIRTCTNVPQNVQVIQQVRDQRQAELSQAQTLSVNALSNGAQLKTSLVQALQDSLTADDAYLTWAQQQEASCTPGSQSSDAAAADAQAVSSKQAFIGRWNPVAAQYGLPRETVASI